MEIHWNLWPPCWRKQRGNLRTITKSPQCLLAALASRGDFNEILVNDENLGGNWRRLKLIYDFCNALDLCGLQDTRLCGGKFTWCNHRWNGNYIWERLDKYLVNADMLRQMELFTVRHLNFIALDHRPILAGWKIGMLDKSRSERQKLLNVRRLLIACGLVIETLILPSFARFRGSAWKN